METILAEWISDITYSNANTNVVCPFDQSHQIPIRYFGKHLHHCREGYLSKKRETLTAVDIFPCQYNYYHQIHRDKMEEHLKVCPSKPGVEIRDWPQTNA